MILLIDNYDSFSYNLYQYLGELTSDVRVIRNDEKTVEEIRAMKPSHIIISPGPGRPENAGVIIDVVKELGKDIPILGVCLGHQAICMAFDAVVTAPLFMDCSEETPVARYHSLAVKKETLPDELKVIAVTTDGDEVMAVMHKKYPIYGVQFHPESILTPEGKKMLKNFLEGQLKIQGAHVSERETYTFARNMIEETQQKRLA